MKPKTFYLSLFLSLSFIFNSCEAEIAEPLVKNGDIPEAPTNIQIQNKTGGAKISYTLPDDANVLYVLATFSSKSDKSKERVAKSSVFKNFILLEGFAESKEYEVTLYSVSRSEVRSAPVTVTIHPLKPPLHDVFESLETGATFGGVYSKFTNEAEQEYTFYIMLKDSITGEYVEYDRLYTQSKERNYATRGLEPEPYDFAFFFKDKWQNTSDTLQKTLTPLYEEEFDKDLWSDARLADDSTTPRYGPLEELWTPGGRTYFFMDAAIPGLKLPNWFTIDLGKKYVFGRMKLEMVSHGATWMYSRGAPENFEIWGSNEATTDWSKWEKLGEFEVTKPSGLPVGEVSEEDIAFALAGEDFVFEPNPEAYRYVRFVTTKTWGGQAAVMLLELSFWGQAADE